MAARRHSYCARCGIGYSERRDHECAAYGRGYATHIWTWECGDEPCDDHGGD